MIVLTKGKNVYLRALLCVVMILSLIPCTSVNAASTVNHTKAEALAWVESMVGTYNLDADGIYPGECVDLILKYYDYLIGGHSGIRGNAKDYATNYVPGSFTRIKGASPQPGDICVNTSGEWGHVWIQGEGNVTYHQNLSEIKQVRKLTGWTYLTAEYVIRPNFKQETKTPITPVPITQAPVIDVDTDKWEKTDSGIYYYCPDQEGFYSNHPIYNKYDCNPLVSSESDSKKRVVSDSQFYTYIYYHWTWSKYERSTYNLYVSKTYKWEGSYEYYNFRAFESSKEYGHTDKYGAYDPDVFYCWMDNPEDGSWWWFRVPVYQQTYTDYTLKSVSPTPITTQKTTVTKPPIATNTPIATVTSTPEHYTVETKKIGAKNPYSAFDIIFNAKVGSGEGKVSIRDASPNATNNITEFLPEAYLYKGYVSDSDLYYEIILRAAPDTGYHFSHWEEEITDDYYNTSVINVSNSANYTISGIAEPTEKTYYAVFVSNTPTPKATATNTPKPTATNTPKPTATNTPKPTATNTPKPTATNTPKPTATSTPVPTATNTPEPTATSTPAPMLTDTPTPTATNTPMPTATDTPTPLPTQANITESDLSQDNTPTPLPTTFLDSDVTNDSSDPTGQEPLTTSVPYAIAADEDRANVPMKSAEVTSQSGETVSKEAKTNEVNPTVLYIIVALSSLVGGGGVGLGLFMLLKKKLLSK